jgi:hypothetical protein
MAFFVAAHYSSRVGGSGGGVIFPQVVHRIMRPVRDAHLLENKLFQVVVSFLSTHSVGVANHGGDGVDERLRDGAG